MVNFFMETISNDHRQTPGGVYRAQEEGVTFFVYMFEEPFRLFAMDVEKTDKRVRELIETGWYRKCRIKNRHYYTEGYPLPIVEFKDCMVDLNTIKLNTIKLNTIKLKLFSRARM